MSQTFITNVEDSDEEDKNDGEEEDNGVINKPKNQKKGSLQFVGCSYKRAKKVVVSPFNKVHQLYNKRKSSSSSSLSSSHKISNLASSSSRSGSCFRCLCMSSKPQTLDTDFEGIDPNDSYVSCEYVKSLIEKNDFYSKECNTHIGD